MNEGEYCTGGKKLRENSDRYTFSSTITEIMLKTAFTLYLITNI